MAESMRTNADGQGMKWRRAMHYVLCASVVACARDQARGADSATVQATQGGGTIGGGGGAVAAGSTAAPRSDARGAASRQAGPRATILFAGTSITAGYGLDPDSAYPQQIQRMIDSAGLAYEVVNAGVSGETSSALLRRVDWLLREPFDVVVLETGANDGLRGIPVESMRANLQAIVERIRVRRPDARVVLVQMEALPNLGAAYTRAFHAAYADVARATGAELLPFLLADVAGRRELNQADGIHPNYEGERIVARNVWKGLKALLQ